MRYPLQAAVFALLGAASFALASAGPRCTILDVSAGSSTSFAVAQDGSLYGWGRFAWLGAGGTEDTWLWDSTYRPIRVSPAGSITSVSGGDVHTIALRPDGTVGSWGHGSGGEFGNGTTPITYAREPVQASGLPAIVAVEGGSADGVFGGFSLALDSDSAVWAWGSNAYGQLGEGTNDLSSLPVPVSGLGADVNSISAGWAHGLARKTDGTVWAWGVNTSAQLGDGTFDNSNVPFRVGGIGTAASVAAGGAHSLVLMSDGTLRAWGSNSYGQLGDGTGFGKTRPVWISTIDQVVGISAGSANSYAIRSDGTLWAWGDDSAGSVGNGPPEWDEWEPVQVTSLSDVVAVDGGDAFALAVTADGNAWAWGYNKVEGLLAQPPETVVFSNVPLKVDFDYVPADQQNVIRAVRSGDDAVLVFDGALAALWQVEATSDKGKTLSVLTSPELEERRFVDSGAVLDGIPRYYQVRGLSLCSATPGP